MVGVGVLDGLEDVALEVTPPQLQSGHSVHTRHTDLARSGADVLYGFTRDARRLELTIHLCSAASVNRLPYFPTSVWKKGFSCKSSS